MANYLRLVDNTRKRNDARLELLSVTSQDRRMTTLSPTEARINLSSQLKRAAKGEDIGILHGDQVIALRPVTVHSDDYALREYDVTERELDGFVKRTDVALAYSSASLFEPNRAHFSSSPSAITMKCGDSSKDFDRGGRHPDNAKCTRSDIR